METYFSAYNEEENFRILVNANNDEEAKELLTGYSKDSGLSNEWSLSKDIGGHYDCDYVIQHDEGDIEFVDDILDEIEKD